MLTIVYIYVSVNNLFCFFTELSIDTLQTLAFSAQKYINEGKKTQEKNGKKARERTISLFMLKGSIHNHNMF